MNSHISVVIPTRNRPSQLKTALESVFKQSMPPDEIIVVDDASWPPINRDVFEGCPGEINAKLLINDSQMGANNARNTGIKEASSSWIAFLDDDDEFKVDKIKTVKTAIENNPDADLFYHPAEIRMINEKASYLTRPAVFDQHADIFRALLIKNHIGGISMTVAKKDSLTKASLFDEDMPALQDYDMWLRMAKKGAKFCFIEPALTTYYCTTKNRSISKSMEANQKALEIIENKHKEVYLGLDRQRLGLHEEWKKRMLIQKAILNKQIWKALKLQIKRFAKNPRPIFLLEAAAILMGTKATYMLRAKLG